MNPAEKLARLRAEMAKRGILCGLTVDNHLLWCVTEKMDKLAIDEVINVIKEVCGQ